jgi:hypothetical protein
VGLERGIQVGWEDASRWYGFTHSKAALKGCILLFYSGLATALGTSIGADQHD